MNKKYVLTAIAAGATLVGCGWYLFKASQRKSSELQEQMHESLRLAQESKFDECVSLLQGTIEEMKQFYGPDNPTTMQTVRLLAEILHRQNKLPEAEILMRQCCYSLEKSLGASHEESLGCQTELMDILGAAGKTSEALAIGTKLFDLLCNKLGPNHVQCVTVGAALCAFMRAEGEMQQSVDLARIIVESCRSGSPSAPSSPESLHMSLRVLAELLRDAGDTEESIHIAQELVAVCTANNLEADGPPQSHYLLLNLQMEFKIEDALLTARSTANYCQQLHGAGSHHHVESQLVLARLLTQNRIFQEAFTTWQLAHDALAQTLGADHHDVLDIQVQMATCLLHTNCLAESEPLFQHVVDMHHVLPDGKLSSTYLMAAHYLSMYTLLKGLELSKAAAHGLNKLLGDKHEKSREAKDVYREFLAKRQVLLPASPLCGEGPRGGLSPHGSVGSPLSVAGSAASSPLSSSRAVE